MGILTSRRRSTVALLSVAGFLLVTSVSYSHFADFTEEVYQNRSIPAGNTEYVTTSSGAINRHSYSFVSAKNLTSGGVVCAIIYDGANQYECGAGFERYCYFAHTHSSNDLDCHDRDTSIWRAGAAVGSASATVQIHGSY